MNTTQIESQILNLLISGLTPDTVANIAATKLGVKSKKEANRLIKAARRSLTIAASINGDEEFGKAKAQLEDCYARAIAVQDVKAAHSIRKELNKLLNLYTRPAAIDGDLIPTQKQLEAIKAHILPLKLTTEHYPVEEHCRIAPGICRSGKDAR